MFGPSGERTITLTSEFPIKLPPVEKRKTPGGKTLPPLAANFRITGELVIETSAGFILIPARTWAEGLPGGGHFFRGARLNGETVQFAIGKPRLGPLQATLTGYVAHQSTASVITARHQRLTAMAVA